MTLSSCYYYGDPPRQPFEAPGVTCPSLTITKYLIGLLVIFATAYSQYLVSGFGLIAGAFAVYGVSIIVITPMRGAAIVRPAFKNTASAIRLGLGLFGIFTLVSILTSVVILSLLTDLDPGAVSLLHRPVPVLNVPPHLAWIMVWLSILIVVPAEEYIFRGFVYGGAVKHFQRGPLVIACIPFIRLLCGRSPLLRPYLRCGFSDPICGYSCHWHGPCDYLLPFRWQSAYTRIDPRRLRCNRIFWPLQCHPISGCTLEAY